MCGARHVRAPLQRSPCCSEPRGSRDTGRTHTNPGIAMMLDIGVGQESKPLIPAQSTFKMSSVLLCSLRLKWNQLAHTKLGWSENHLEITKAEDLSLTHGGGGSKITHRGCAAGPATGQWDFGSDTSTILNIWV